MALKPTPGLLQAFDKAGDFAPGISHDQQFTFFDLVRVEVQMHGVSVNGDSHSRRVTMSLSTPGSATYRFEADTRAVEFFTHMRRNLQLAFFE
jgi:hypothetical protein